MSSLLDSSWMKFGSADRNALDWAPDPSGQPSTDRLARKDSEAILSTVSITYIVIAAVSFLLLFLGVLGLLIWRRRRGYCLDGKLELANVIDLEDLQDPERNSEVLSSIRRSRRQHQVPSSSSEQDVTDGVFLMVYLPPPYEQTLTRIARAASIRSSKNVELRPPSPGPEAVNRGEEEREEGEEGGEGEGEGSRLKDKVDEEEEIKD